VLPGTGAGAAGAAVVAGAAGAAVAAGAAGAAVAAGAAGAAVAAGAALWAATPAETSIQTAAPAAHQLPSFAFPIAHLPLILET
jgi:hypothetical protein